MPNAADYTTVLKVDRNAKIDQRLGLMGYDPNELPSGWGGGLRTLDVYAAGTVGTGSGGTVNAYMNKEEHQKVKLFLVLMEYGADQQEVQ